MPTHPPCIQPAGPRDPAAQLRTAWAQFQAQPPAADGSPADLWLFAYASLIWRPGFDPSEVRPARVRGWHRALAMWSRINRGTPECPGLVFALLPGGSCRGMVLRVPRPDAEATLATLWQREMPNGVYDPRWLPCDTPAGPVRALAFTLSRRSPSHAGTLEAAQLQAIFRDAQGRYGSTRDYAETTLHSLRQHGIADRALARLIADATPAVPAGPASQPTMAAQTRSATDRPTPQPSSGGAIREPG